MTHTIVNKNSVIKDIVILGGGTAGWMSAASLSKVLDKDKYNITLIESDQIGTVGVGEATIPQMSKFNQGLGIDEKTFMQKTQATFKLGIDFRNWSKKGESYIHPFSRYGYDFGDLPFHQYWQKLYQQGKAKDIDAYSLNIQACYQNKFIHAQNVKNSPLANIAYAYHLDAGMYATFMRDYSEKNGVKRVEGKVAHVHKDTENGFISSLQLENGESIQGDFFIDCSGFRSLLIGDALGVKFENWSHLLPADRAVTAQSEGQVSKRPYTISSALSAGWQWQIPLQHRTGNGHVYSSHFISDDNAEKELRDNITGKLLTDPRIIQFTTGKREKIWEKNCLAIGLSGGFLEPLESTSIYLVQATISRFFGLFPKEIGDQTLTAKFNQQMNEIFIPIRDFIIAHYHVNQRDDSEYWKYCQEMDVPDNVKDKINLYTNTSRLYRENNELFNETSWLAVLHGQGLKAEGYNPLADIVDEDNLIERFNNTEGVIKKCADKMPTHSEYVIKGFASDPI